jgi:hypothetical protein
MYIYMSLSLFIYTYINMILYGHTHTHTHTHTHVYIWVQESLDQQRRDDARLAKEEDAAHRRAQAEEAKLKAAQHEVLPNLI